MEGLLNDRCILIMKSLITKGVLTLKELKHICNVSERTISKDLDIIEGLVKEHKLLLYRKPKLGIWIEGSEKDKERLYVSISVNNPKIPNSPKERQEYILLKLIQALGYVTMQELCDEIYISRGTLENDLNYVENIIVKNGLKLKRTTNRGIKIIGDEKKLRTLIAGLFSRLSYVMPVKELVTYIGSTRIDTGAYSFEKDLFNLFSDLNLGEIEKIICEAADKFQWNFTDNAFASLLIHIAVAIKRIKSNSQVNFTENILSSLEITREYKIAEFIAKNIEKAFLINVSKTECAYISIHILGSKVQFNIINDEGKVLNRADVSDSVEELCKEMVAKAAEALDMDLINDKILLKGLSMHIRAALNRLVHDMPVKNPLLDSIKNSYVASFEAAVSASTIIKERYKLAIDENEIAYIALHIEAAIERMKNNLVDKKRIIFVCSTGIGTSQLVSSKLRRVFNNIEIVDILSSMDLKNKKLDNIDFIITTIPLVIDSVPVIRVNPLLLQEDLDNIEKFMSRSTSPEIAKKNNLKNVLQLIDRDLLFINKNFSTREEAVYEISKLMYQKGYVAEDYYDSIISREKIASTASGRVALPHGDMNKVYKSVVSICALNNKLNWDGNNKIDIIIMMSIRKKDLNKIQAIFECIYDIMSDNRLINKILNCKDKEEILEIMFE